MQASIIAMDANLGAGATTYHLEFARGTLSGKTFQANCWAVFLELEQVLR
jgi:hypothetical protein